MTSPYHRLCSKEAQIRGTRTLYKNETLTGVTIRLDDDEVIGCQLISCEILFGGRRVPIYTRNRAIDCRFQFADTALVTIGILRRMLRVPSLREVVLGELGLLGEEEDTLH